MSTSHSHWCQPTEGWHQFKLCHTKLGFYVTHTSNTLLVYMETKQLTTWTQFLSKDPLRPKKKKSAPLDWFLWNLTFQYFFSKMFRKTIIFSLRPKTLKHEMFEAPPPGPLSPLHTSCQWLMFYHCAGRVALLKRNAWRVTRPWQVYSQPKNISC
jgi:hypothetical protein